MIHWRQGTVRRLGRKWPGAVELDVEIADGTRLPALAYPLLVGRPEPGDRVLLNASALELGLGTGGHALVVALPDRLPPDPPAAGRLVKARYTPLQALVAGPEEAPPPASDVLDGMPVVVADLHSALPAVVAGVLAERPTARVAYVMTDGGALPIWYSRTVAGLRRTVTGLRPMLCGTVTAGQAFGGEVEAVTVYDGLLAARHVLRADVAVVTQGPGNLGSASTWGFSGVAAGEAVNAVSTLGGRPVASLRISGADPRPRHRGVSHHSLTAYGRVALTRADVVVPAPLLEELAGVLVPLAARHALVPVDTDGLDQALRALPVELSTMGRGLDGDPAYFLAAAAAGRHAARLLTGSADDG